MELLSFLQELNARLYTYVALISAGILAYVFLPYIWDFVKRYQGVLLVVTVVFFVMGFLADEFLFLMYHITASPTVAFAPFLTLDTVSTILQMTLAAFLVSVYAVFRPFFSK